MRGQFEKWPLCVHIPNHPDLHNKMSDKRAADLDAPTSAPKRSAPCCSECKRGLEYLPEIASDVEILSTEKPELPSYRLSQMGYWENMERNQKETERANQLIAKHYDALKPMLDVFTVGTHRVSDLMERAHLTKFACTVQRHYAVSDPFIPVGEEYTAIEIHMSKLRWNSENTATMELRLIWREPDPYCPDSAYSCEFVGPILRISLRVVGKSDK